jgi:hypothetical protein
MSDNKDKKASLWEATNMGFNDRDTAKSPEDVLAALQLIREARKQLDAAEALLLGIQAKLQVK